MSDGDGGAMIHDEHVDEGTIHAWLDGALEPDAAARVAAHVESCASCRTQVAEAHGLIAGASRVVGLLDDAPATTGPRWGTGADAAGAARRPARDATSAWRRLRITPARAGIAAT